MDNVNIKKASRYHIYEYPANSSNEQYYFVLKHSEKNQLITACARELIYYYPNIMSQLSIKESNKIHFYHGLEVANKNEKLRLAIRSKKVSHANKYH